MHNNGIFFWPTLGGINFFHRLGLQRICGKTVDCLRRQCHQSTCAQNCRRLLHRIIE